TTSPVSAILQPKIVISLTTVIVLLILFSLGQEMNRRWQIEREVVRLEQEADEVQKHVTELANLNQYFRTPDFQERLAREKLNYRAPGEEVVLIPEDEQVSEVPLESQQIQRATVVSVPLKWWNAFFGQPALGT
ncbi:MAG: septum formation initiator family protein, partial [Candidatus Andersenbacteria bacterium]|nr:septum formation initiator family protein [Candidatus Andersenbacteria bacterium]